MSASCPPSLQLRTSGHLSEIDALGHKRTHASQQEHLLDHLVGARRCASACQTDMHGNLFQSDYCSTNWRSLPSVLDTSKRPAFVAGAVVNRDRAWTAFIRLAELHQFAGFLLVEIEVT